MSAQTEYKVWLNAPELSEEERRELASIQDDAKEIEDRFFAPLAFGTGGLRGIMGVGLNRMNVHVVRHATQALANLILHEGPEAARRGVAIAYDCRNHADEFAREAAAVLAANGIHVRLFDALRPTPELSFAVREYGCIAGINVTASHNPKQYNGYKAYWSDGAQLPPVHADVVSREMGKIDIFRGVLTMPFDEALGDGRIEMLGEETDRAFLACVLSQSVAGDAVRTMADRFKLVYTPFHGAGCRLVPEALKQLGFKHILCEPSQMIIDGDFPTVASPNPENKEGFALAIDLARQHDVDLIIGTDPDADRVGIVVRDRAGDFVTMTGNQVGVLLTDYLIKARETLGTMPSNPALITTIVSTPMAGAVAEKHGVAVFETFTGFKFIAEAIGEMEKNHSHHYLLGYEESYGYLVGDHARDKDAVVASMLIAEMAAWYAQKGMTLFDVMQSLYEEYGYYRESTLNLVMPGVDGLMKMQALMASLRSDPPLSMAEIPVTAIRDYLKGERMDLTRNSIEHLSLKGSDVLCFERADGTRVVVRPSGTEPKVKIYILTKAPTSEAADRAVAELERWAQTLTN